jgi:iron complex outermembrane receptor protein
MVQALSQYAGGSLANTPETSKTNTVEVRLTSNETRPLQYVVGLYYFYESSVGAQQTYGNILAAGFASRAVLQDTDNSVAVFGQATYTPTGFDRLHITLGGRENQDKKSGTDDVIIVPLNSHNPNVDVGATWRNASYKVGLSFDITSSNLLYVNQSTGYKAGGVAFGPFPLVPPEKNTAFEVGSKNRFFNDKLQLNLDYFHYRFTNPEFLTAATTVVNNANVNTLEVITADYETMSGVEMGLQFAPTANDRFDMSLDYLKARIHELNYANPVYRVNGGLDLKDTQLFDAPKWTGRASFTHTFHVATSSIAATAGVYYADAHTVSYPTRYTGLANSPAPSIQALAPALQGTIAPAVTTPTVAIADVSVRYAPDGGKWSLTGFVSNVTNKAYLYSGNLVTSGTSPLFNSVIGFQSPPRTFGGQVSVNF